MFMASYPSGLRGRFAKPLFAGSNPADASFRHSTLFFASDLARVVELVDTTDLKSVGCISRAGSSPAPGTHRQKALNEPFSFSTKIGLYPNVPKTSAVFVSLVMWKLTLFML